MRRTLLKVGLGIISSFVFVLSAKAQNPSFRSPLDIPLQLSANFGEIRTDHYHTGYDIRTNSKSGYKVYAAADGYVSRIKVAAGGFGKVLYITHKNGFMTVYAHLDRFNDVIGKYVKEQQYSKQSFEIELFPDASIFPVKEGDVIAFSGNSGSSSGPHLHFEIRDASGETYPLNPKEFLPLQDHSPPKFSSLYVYPRTKCCDQIAHKEYDVAGSGSHFKLKTDSIIVTHEKIGLAVEIEDRVDLSTTTLGVYKLEAYADEELIFSQKLDRLNFANNRYVNAHIDYREWKKNNSIIRKLFLLPADRNTIYDETQNKGIITFTDTLWHTMRITAADDQGNISMLNFTIRFTGPNPQGAERADTSIYFDFDKANVFQADSLQLHLPSNVLYEGMYFHYLSEIASDPTYLSAVHHLDQPFTPLHSYCDLYVLPRKIPDSVKNKAVIIYRNANRKLTAKASKWEGAYLTARIRDFGDYFVMLDTKAPVIKPLGVKENQLLTGNEIMFRTEDNLTGIDSYSAFLDGKWLLMEYDPKNDRFICLLDDDLASGTHTIRITAKDAVGNEVSYVLNFKR